MNINLNEKMKNAIDNFNTTIFPPYDEMLCDEIGAYVHAVSTLRMYARELNMTREYERFDALYVKSFAYMTHKYFNNIDESLQYLINNY